jgi:hypothetical protein
MRVIVTASGIQDYIFDITARRAAARLRGRSARLGLVIDHCLLQLQSRFGSHIHVKRNAGSCLELESDDAEAPAVAEYLKVLQHDLDAHTRAELDGQVWFSTATGTDSEAAYSKLGDQKLKPGQGVLQTGTGWDEAAFTFRRKVDERWLEANPEEARELSDAVLGSRLAHARHRLIRLTPAPKRDERGAPLPAHSLGLAEPLAYYAEADSGAPHGDLVIELVDEDGKATARLSKQLARYAPLDEKYHLVDLGEIAERSQGAAFLGVLKADLDNLGTTFGNDKVPEDRKKELSDKLERLFAGELENIIRSRYHDCYVVYSGGDDLFLLGPWGQLIRFINEFREKVKESVEAWERQTDLPSDPEHRPLTLSAGFRLAHPKSPIRYLAEEAEAALHAAKTHRDGKAGEPETQPDITKGQEPHKNCISVFERILRWEELDKGIEWADRFVKAVETQGLSASFLQRMQYYASESRRFHECEKIDGLRMVPLLQNDWHRNIDRIEESLRNDLNREVYPLLVQTTTAGERMWRIMDFASRFAVYAGREGRKENG